MHEKISKFISETFYEGNLTNAENPLLFGETPESKKSGFLVPFVFFDIESDETLYNNSYINMKQIQFIIRVYERLKEIYGLDYLKDNLAIISPYSMQVLRIKEEISRLENTERSIIEVNTVDGFQGKEKNCVIFSTVRSKGSKTIGFLSDERRMNVGLSRAKSSLMVIGDSRKLIKDENWEKLVKYSYRECDFYKVPNDIEKFIDNFETLKKTSKIHNDEDFIKEIYTNKILL